MKLYLFKCFNLQGRQGEKKWLNPNAAHTQELLRLGHIVEVDQKPDAEKRETKVVEPKETKRKGKAKK